MSASPRATSVRGFGDALRPVREVRRIVESTRLGEQPVEAGVCRMFGLDPAARLDVACLDDLVRRHVHHVTEDLAPSAADDLASRFLDRLDPGTHPRTVGDLVHDVAGAYVGVAREWAGLIVSFVADARRRCRRLGVDQVVMLARDGIVLQSVWAAAPAARGDARCVLVDLNREMAGWPDPSDGSGTGRLHRYLGHRLDLSARTVVIDTGLYGTLVHTLADHGLDDLGVIFLTSKNPDLFGWLNALVPAGPRRESTLGFASHCVDSIESWPKAYQDTRWSTGDGGTTPVARLTDPLSVAAHLAMVDELAGAARDRVRGVADDPAGDLRRLYRAHHDARRVDDLVPVVLPDAVPDWDARDEFLRRTWRPGARAPLMPGAPNGVG